MKLYVSSLQWYWNIFCLSWSLVFRFFERWILIYQVLFEYFLQKINEGRFSFLNCQRFLKSEILPMVSSPDQRKHKSHWIHCIILKSFKSSAVWHFSKKHGRGYFSEKTQIAPNSKHNFIKVWWGEWHLFCQKFPVTS